MIWGISEPLSLLFYLAPSGWRWKVVLGGVISIVRPISPCWRASDSGWLRCLTSTMLLARLWKCPPRKVNPVMVCSPPGRPSPSTWRLLSCTLSSCGNVQCFILSTFIILLSDSDIRKKLDIVSELWVLLCFSFMSSYNLKIYIPIFFCSGSSLCLLCGWMMKTFRSRKFSCPLCQSSMIPIA